VAFEPFLSVQEVPERLKDEFDDYADLTDVIRQASRVVRDELKTARFATVDGVAVDQLVIDALREATIAQMSWWSETGDISGAGVQLGGGGIGSVRLPGGNATNVARERRTARTAPEVAQILRDCEAIEWNVSY
jgi:hypothetical protein